MTTYTTIANSEVDPDSPVTSTLMTRMRDNPLAQAEGASGAPKIAGAAMGTLYLGNVYPTGVADAAILALDRVKTVFASGPIETVGDLRIRYSADNGGSYGSWFNIFTSTAGPGFYNITIDLVTGAVVIQGFDDNAPGLSLTTTSTTATASANALQLGFTSGSATTSRAYLTAFAVQGVSP